MGSSSKHVIARAEQAVAHAEALLNALGRDPTPSETILAQYAGHAHFMVQQLARRIYTRGLMDQTRPGNAKGVKSISQELRSWMRVHTDLLSKLGIRPHEITVEEPSLVDLWGTPSREGPSTQGEDQDSPERDEQGGDDQ